MCMKHSAVLPIEQLLVAIDEGVEPPDLEAMVARAAAAGVSAKTLRRVRSLARRLAEGRRREELLRVLHDTATDLTGIRDVEAVLQAIVVRTRHLVGSDMAYISLNDHERNETYIRKSTGVSTPEYRTIRMPLGTGVLGSVATGLSPVSCVDYLAETRIIHLEDIDRIVRGEGVRAIMGVPLSVHGRVLGALLVAERTARRFTPEEIDLVDSVGKQAAVALDNAERFAEVRVALDRLGAERHQDAVDLRALGELVDLDERLVEAVVRSRDLADVAQISRDALGHDMAILHPDGRLLASAAADPDHPDRPPVPRDWIAESRRRAEVERALSAARVTGRAQVITASRSGGALTAAAAMAGPEHLATLVVPGELGPGQRTVLERIAVFVTVIRLFTRAAQTVESQRQVAVFEDLLAGRLVDARAAGGVLEHFGLAPGRDVVVTAIQTSRPHDTLDAVRSSLRNVPALVAAHEDHVCVLSQEPCLPATIETFTKRGLEWRAAELGGLPADRIPQGHRQVTVCLAGQQALGTWGRADASAVGAVAAVLESSLTGDYPLLEVIAPLTSYDAAHSTDLARTAWLYLEAGDRTATVAERLFVHRNTVHQRLSRVGQLLGDGWDRSPRRLDIHLALSVHQARAR